MNQKDYKEIAGIIKDNFKDFLFQSDALVLARQNISKELADCFEREYQERLEKNMGKIYGKGKPIDNFNKQQFLKDCGVEK